MNTPFLLLLCTMLLCFLHVSNPTRDEFSSWYVGQTLRHIPDADFEAVSDACYAHLYRYARRTDYLLCSVFTYEGRKVLGVGLMFFPAAC